MLTVALLPHSASPEPAVTALKLAMERTTSGLLHLEYTLEGDVQALRTERFTSAHRGDQLWEHTCFELFVRTPDSAAYCELNFATSGAWAGYRFSDYRLDMQPIQALQPSLQLQRERSKLCVNVSLPLAQLHPSYAGAALQLAPSAVIENSAGQRSYWAAHHAAAKPDFHHAEAFVVTLNVPEH